MMEDVGVVEVDGEASRGVGVIDDEGEGVAVMRGMSVMVSFFEEPVPVQYVAIAIQITAMSNNTIQVILLINKSIQE
ncbi:MAG: hypothetical protein UW68_C0047G0015 [Candidatus Collierbacteria bacterium GW2011_GWB1_44_6]|uniref:Uncharacterized protein n=1 Tax=Candidatus Collierbacteria bacterium GW2011_GWB1_44_6 TaxID=1618384 RepID=A0A0G1MJJ3_9BACT|nr:MAG: hypothetical protein UW68_C0047G0015 [Candidatus Collierbacteria bacterium GW2011_GWB1_44_6]